MKLNQFSKQRRGIVGSHFASQEPNPPDVHETGWQSTRKKFPSSNLPLFYDCPFPYALFDGRAELPTKRRNMFADIADKKKDISNLV